MMTRALGNAYVKLESCAAQTESFVPLGAQIAEPDIIIARVSTYRSVVVASDGMDKYEFVVPSVR
jgi:hypothetical protein